jgi:glutamine amidotransferase-like uncharacterized protein
MTPPLKSKENTGNRWRHLGYLPVAALLVLAAALGCGDGSNDPREYSDRIAVYDGNGGWHESAVAAKAALEADNQTVDLVSDSDVQTSLEEYGLLVLTAEDPRTMLASLGATGRLQVRSFVESGGGLIALGTASYAAGDSLSYNNLISLEQPLGLFRGYTSGPILSLAGPGSHTMVLVTLTTDVVNPTDMFSVTTLYRGGPLFFVESAPNAHVLARYDLSTNDVAALSMSSGAGRVVLFGVHPEIEEGSDRDGSDWGSTLTDPDSEWEWLQLAAQWSLRQIN